MAQPTQSDLHVNALLSNLSLMYAQEATAFVARRVFPVIPVAKQSDLYARYSRADFNRNLPQLRGPSTESAGGGWKVDTTQSYLCKVWGLHKDIDDQVRANADAVFNLDVEATKWLVNQFLISREVDWASQFFGNVWTTLLTGVASSPSANQALQWNDPNSNPITDVRLLKTTVQLASGGFRPNKLVLGRPVWDVLCDHPDFIERIKFGGTNAVPAKVALAAAADLFELDEVLVMDAIINTGVEQAGPDSGGTNINAGESNAFIGGASGVGGKAALLVYTPAAPGLMTPGCGYTFTWTSYLGATANGERVSNFYMQWLRSDRVEMESAYAHKQVSADLGAYLATIIA